jgi:hypothetical protein
VGLQLIDVLICISEMIHFKNMPWRTKQRTEKWWYRLNHPTFLQLECLEAKSACFALSVCRCMVLSAKWSVKVGLRVNAKR